MVLGQFSKNHPVVKNRGVHDFLLFLIIFWDSWDSNNRKSKENK